jgi:uncharacterized protein (DUF488 family)
MNLYTIGYEGQTPDSFLNALISSGVRRVVDVRQVPLSHKAGFSKTRLGDFLRSKGIEYLHLPALGCPKDIRNDFRAGMDFEIYKNRYLAFMAGRQAELDELLESVQKTPSCLLCFEADHERCHRSFIAARLAEMSTGKLTVAPIIPGLTRENRFST